MTYLKAPALYSFLANDKRWQAQFQEESYTVAEQHAITAAKQSKWGGSFTNIFPAIPSIDHRTVRVTASGNGAAQTSGKAQTIPVTVVSRVKQTGQTFEVEFEEIWNNGDKQHTWTYQVNAKDQVTGHSQSGDPVPN